MLALSKSPLFYLRLRLLNKVCSCSFHDLFYIYRMFYIGKDSCSGDSGGPLTYREPNDLWYQVGFVIYATYAILFLFDLLEKSV